MATFILKSLGIGYGMIVAFFFLSYTVYPFTPFWFAFLAPLFVWPALLIVSALVALVLKAIEEHKAKSLKKTNG